MRIACRRKVWGLMWCHRRSRHDDNLVFFFRTNLTSLSPAIWGWQIDGTLQVASRASCQSCQWTNLVAYYIPARRHSEQGLSSDPQDDGILGMPWCEVWV